MQRPEQDFSAFLCHCWLIATRQGLSVNRKLAISASLVGKSPLHQCYGYRHTEPSPAFHRSAGSSNAGFNVGETITVTNEPSSQTLPTLHLLY